MLKKKQLKDLAFFNGTLRETGVAPTTAGLKDYYVGSYFSKKSDRPVAGRNQSDYINRMSEASTLLGSDKENGDLVSPECKLTQSGRKYLRVSAQCS